MALHPDATDVETWAEEGSQRGLRDQCTRVHYSKRADPAVLKGKKLPGDMFGTIRVGAWLIL